MSTTLPSSPEAVEGNGKSVVEEWLLRFAVNCGQPLDDGRVALWRDEFSEVEADLLDRAFRSVLRAHAFSNMPSVGEIWTRIDEIRKTDLAERQRVEEQRWLSNQPPWEELHRRGLAYCESVRGCTQEIAQLQEAARLKVCAEPLVIATSERLAELDRQRKQIRAREWHSA